MDELDTGHRKFSGTDIASLGRKIHSYNDLGSLIKAVEDEPPKKVSKLKRSKMQLGGNMNPE